MGNYTISYTIKMLVVNGKKLNELFLEASDLLLKNEVPYEKVDAITLTQENEEFILKICYREKG